jgi:hypothetical protein
VTHKTWTLIGRDGKPYQSLVKGTLGGHRKTHIYGRMNCRTALRAIAHGGYTANRVFFLDEDTARAAGFRPCSVCMHDEYLLWKRGRATQSTTPDAQSKTSV